jgi:hypothetical protein
MTNQEKMQKRIAREVRKVVLSARQDFNETFKNAEDKQDRKAELQKNLERWEKFVRQYESLQSPSDSGITET